MVLCCGVSRGGVVSFLPLALLFLVYVSSIFVNADIDADVDVEVEIAAPAPVLVSSKKWKLSHAWIGHESTSSIAFTHRSDITLSMWEHEEVATIAIANVEDPVATLPTIKSFLQHNPHGLYQLHLQEVEQDGTTVSDGSSSSIVSVPACALLQSNFREEIVLRLGTGTAAIGLSYLPLVGPLSPPSCRGVVADGTPAEDSDVDAEATAAWEEYFTLYNMVEQAADADADSAPAHAPPLVWETRISYETFKSAMVLNKVMPNYKPPPGLKFLPRKTIDGRTTNNLADGSAGGGPTGAGGGDGGPDGDNKKAEFPTTPMGFAKRYWYILLPLLISNFMGAPAASEEDAPQQQQQQQVQGGGAGGGGEAKKRVRRGKKE